MESSIVGERGIVCVGNLTGCGLRAAICGKLFACEKKKMKLCPLPPATHTHFVPREPLVLLNLRSQRWIIETSFLAREM